MKREIYFCTGNKSKLDEANLIAGYLGNTITFKRDDCRFTEIQSLSQEEILLDKMKQRQSNLFPFIIDETGIFFDDHTDFPGTLTKFIFKTLGYEGISKILTKNKKAYFKTTILYSHDGTNYAFFSGKLNGKIEFERSSLFNPDFPFSSIFIPDGADLPLMELYKNPLFTDHRKIAIQAMLKYILARK